MKNEIGIKPETLLGSLTSNLAKKPKVATNVDFSAEVSKKAYAQSNVKVKATAEKTDSVSNSVKPEGEKPEEKIKEVGVNVEKIEQPVENEDNIVAMQVQQLAINTLTVENKEDIPEIKLPNTFEGNAEIVKEEPEVKTEVATLEKAAPKLESTGNIQKFAKIQELAEVDVSKTENSEKTVEKIETKVKIEEESLPLETVKKVEEQAETPSGKLKPDLAVNTNAGEKPLDLGKINIKVADVPLKAETPEMPQQLVDKILYNVDKGKHVFDIELFPDNLGKLEIKMIFEKGTAQLVMTTHTDKAHKLLSQQIDTIKNILEVSTQNQSNVEIKESEKASENFDRDNFAGQREKEQQEQNPKENRKEETESFVDRLKFGLLEEA